MKLLERLQASRKKRFLKEHIKKTLGKELVISIDVDKLVEFDANVWFKHLKEIGIALVDMPYKVELTQQEILHLEWIHARMQFIHKENPNYDYMLKFAEIIKKLKV